MKFPQAYLYFDNGREEGVQMTEEAGEQETLPLHCKDALSADTDVS